MFVMSAVMEVEGDKKGTPKRRGDTGGRSLLFFRKYAPRQIRNFCPFFCMVSVVFSLVQTSLAHSEGIRLEECLPVGELTGTTPCFSKQEKKIPYFAKTKGWGKRKYAQLNWLY